MAGDNSWSLTLVLSQAVEIHYLEQLWAFGYTRVQIVCLESSSGKKLKRALSLLAENYRDGTWPKPDRVYFWPAVNKIWVLFDPTRWDFFWPEGKKLKNLGFLGGIFQHPYKHYETFKVFYYFTSVNYSLQFKIDIFSLIFFLHHFTYQPRKNKSEMNKFLSLSLAHLHLSTFRFQACCSFALTQFWRPKAYVFSCLWQ